MNIDSAERLLYYRKLYGVTRQQLSDNTGISVSTIRTLEGGSSKSNEKFWKRISEYFNRIKTPQYKHNISDGSELLRVRTNMGISRNELATRTGISYSMICSIENQTKKGSVQTWNKINAYLDADYDDESQDILARLRRDMTKHGPDVLLKVKFSRVNYRLFSVDDYAVKGEDESINDEFIVKAKTLYELLHYGTIKERRKIREEKAKNK